MKKSYRDEGDKGDEENKESLKIPSILFIPGKFFALSSYPLYPLHPC